MADRDDGGPAVNPRYLQYCRVQDRSPAEQLEHDRDAYPGGSAAGFLIWHLERIEEAKKDIPAAFTDGRLHDRAAYDKWLVGRTDDLIAARKGGAS